MPMLRPTAPGLPPLDPDRIGSGLRIGDRAQPPKTGRILRRLMQGLAEFAKT